MFLQTMFYEETLIIPIPIKRQKDNTPSLEKEMEKLTICGARALAAALDSDSIRVSLPRKLYYRKIIKMELTKKKFDRLLTWHLFA